MCSIYRVTFLKIINHDYPQKKEAITFPAEETLSNFLGACLCVCVCGVGGGGGGAGSQGASTVCFAFKIPDQSDGPESHPGSQLCRYIPQGHPHSETRDTQKYRRRFSSDLRSTFWGPT